MNEENKLDRSRNLNVRIDDGLRHKLLTLAASKGERLSTIVRMILRKAVEEEDAEKLFEK